MTEEKAKSLIGRKVRGFEFEVGYVYEMNKHINEVGIIEHFDSKCKEFRVHFENDHWYYPASLIEAHLVEEEPTSEYHLVQIEGEDFSYKTVNITASELINQNEQLKAENAEFLELLKMHVENRKGAYKFMNNIEKELHEKTKQTLEKHGK